MYVNFVIDRQNLGFSCIKDLNTIKQLSDFKSTLKNSVTWIIRKGKQTLILLFSKEVLVAVFIFLESSYIKLNVDYPLFSSYEVYQSCDIKSDTSEFLTTSSQILDYILKLKGGSDELTNEEQEKLVNSILAKAPESSYSEISINKFLKRILELMAPVISNQRFWRILSEFGKPLKSELPGPSEVRSTDILGPYAPDKQAKTRFRGSSSIFAEAFPIPTPRKLSPMETRVQLKMAGNKFPDNLESSGLSRNHEELSEKIQVIEKLTRLRRAQPLYPSQALGDSYQYGGEQLKRKAPRHLEDFGISTEGKTKEEMAIEYKDFLESLVSKQNLVIREEGTLNKQEPTINIGDPESLGIVVFENNPLYEDHHFISGYPISEKAFEAFKETGNIGSSPEERAQEINELQRTKAQAEREKSTERSFYSNLPEDARIGNKQLREVETIQEQLKQDPSISLTEKEKSMVQRVEKYQQYKNKFYQDNPGIGRNEF